MVFEKLREILAEQLEIKKRTIKMDSLLIDDLGAGSLDIVDLVMSIEDEFEVEVPDEIIEQIATVGDAVRFIEENK
ncbi:MAG: acyl carrier protein [Ruminococcaceae bacterium]|nr:acyl carrier protein [Oscillospiraceae bacterium]